MVLIQLILCMEGSVIHLMLFAFSNNQMPESVVLLNNSMRWCLPCGYVLSFVIACVGMYSQVAAVALGVCTALLVFLPLCAQLMRTLCSGDVTGSDTAVVNVRLANESTTKETIKSVKAEVEAEKEWAKADKDGDGQIDREELRQYTEEVRGEEHPGFEQLFHEMFLRYDLDQSGSIDSKQELTQLTTALLYKLNLDVKLGASPTDVDMTVDAALQDNKGDILWSEAVAKEWFLKSFM